MFTQLKRAITLAVALGALAGCSADVGKPTDMTQAPTSAASSDLVGSLVSKLIPVTGLQRVTALPAPITVTQTIGSAGGVLTIPAAGVVVTIPSGALVAPTVVSMTARAGTLVAYDFSPHGITFAKPITFTQSLVGTRVSLLSPLTMHLGYYTGSDALTATGALVTELINGTVSLLTWTFTANITHFSGYIVSCG